MGAATKWSMTPSTNSYTFDMALSPTLQTALDALNEPREFLTYSGMRDPLPISVDSPADLQATLESLNGLLYIRFPQIKCSERDELFGPFRAPAPEELDMLGQLAQFIVHPGLRARAYELLWATRLGKAVPDDAIKSAQAYLEYGRMPQPDEDQAATLERALRLSGTYARHPDGSPVFLDAQQMALDVVQDSTANPNWRCVALRLLIETWKECPGGLTWTDLLHHVKALDLVQKSAGNHTWRWTLAELRLEAASHLDQAEKQAAREHFAQVRVEEGDAHAADHPVRAKQAYMDAERRYVDLNMRTEADQMRQKGAALAPAIFASMKPIEHDIGDYVKYATSLAERQARLATTLNDYLKALAVHHAVQPKSDDASKDSGLRRLFGHIHFGHGGQVLNANGESGEPGFPLDDMQFHAQLSAILNSRLWIAADARWKPVEEELLPLVAGRPVVPTLSAMQITLGILFALHGDPLVGATMLAAMPEAIFRHALQIKGKVAPYTEPTRVQMQTTLGTLLDPTQPLYSELVALFGEDLMLDAKRVLDTESLNVRNTMLHGLGGDKYAADWPGCSLIQLVIRLVFADLPGWPQEEQAASTEPVLEVVDDSLGTPGEESPSPTAPHHTSP